MQLKYINREKCAVTKINDLEPLHTFYDFPIFMGCTEKSSEEDLKFNMEWYISKSSGLIQLKKLIPLEILYPESHGSGLVGSLWNEHHFQFSEYINEVNNFKNILEIGGAHGLLANNYLTKNKNSKWTIIEPNPSVENNNITVIKDFFNEKFKVINNFDLIVHSHVLEHIYDPDQFIRYLSEYMFIGQRLIFSIPNMKEMLKRKYNNCLNFEHTVFIDEPYLKYLFYKYGFEIIDKKYFKEDHSIFFNVIKNNKIKKTYRIPNSSYLSNKKLYFNYIQYHKNMVLEINKQISTHTGNIYLFGAHIFSQYLIEFGVKIKKIKFILDNDNNKQEKRLYGTNLMVKSPKILAFDKNPLVILKAGVYNNEIKKDIINNINDETIFIE